MQIFTPIYQKMLQWASHRSAAKYLAAVSFAESSFFPIPVDVMLAPMALANRDKAWRYALLATVMSVLGALFGYFIGAVLFESIGESLINALGWQAKFAAVQDGYVEWGVWIVLIASFTPFPYKIVTITAGIAGLNLPLFVALSIVGRGARFYMVAGLVRACGPAIEGMLDKWVERIGWSVFVLLVVAAFAYKSLQ